MALSTVSRHRTERIFGTVLELLDNSKKVVGLVPRVSWPKACEVNWRPNHQGVTVPVTAGRASSTSPTP